MIARQGTAQALAVSGIVGVVLLIAIAGVLLVRTNQQTDEGNLVGNPSFNTACDLSASQMHGQTLTYTVKNRQITIKTLIDATGVTFIVNGQTLPTLTPGQSAQLPNGTKITLTTIINGRARFCLKLDTQLPTCTSPCTQPTCTSDGKLRACTNGCYTQTTSCPIGEVCQNGTCQPPQAPGTNNAQFVNQTIPATMTAGQQYNVSITVKNTGTTTWTAAGNYKLGSQNPQDNIVWGMGRVHLPTDSTISPGQEHTFTFQVTAPTQPGTYNFQWRMLREMIAWFGDLTPPVQIAVIPSTSCTAAQMQCGNACCSATTLSDGTKVRFIGSTDQQDGTFHSPLDVDVMPDGRIVVADAINQQVQVFSSQLVFLSRFGKPGTDPDENNDVMSVAATHDGHIFSADIHSAIKEFAGNYQFVRRHNWAPGNNPTDQNFRRVDFPRKIYADRSAPNNYIYIADMNNNRITRFTRMPDGTLGDHKLFNGTGVGGQLGTPFGFAAYTTGSETREYVINLADGTVRRYKNMFGLSPQYLGNLPGVLAQPHAIALDVARNRIYISYPSSNKIQVFTLDGTPVSTFGSAGSGQGQFNSPQGIAVDAQGNLLVADANNHRIQRVSPTGAFIGATGQRNPLVNGKIHRAATALVDAAANEVYVGDIYNCQIQVFNLQGQFKRRFGSCVEYWHMNDVYTGDKLSYIGDFDIDNGRIYIADSFNSRIAVFSTQGQFLFSFGTPGVGEGKLNNPLTLEVVGNRLLVGDWEDFIDSIVSGKVSEFDLNGNYVRTFSQSGTGVGQVLQPIGIFTDPRNGRIFVSDAHDYVDVYNAQGVYQTRFQIIADNGIIVHADGVIMQDGTMWLASGSDRLEKWNADTLTKQSVFGSHGDAPGQFRYPLKPSIGPDGEMYIGDWNDRVSVVKLAS